MEQLEKRIAGPSPDSSVAPTAASIEADVMAARKSFAQKVIFASTSDLLRSFLVPIPITVIAVHILITISPVADLL